MFVLSSQKHLGINLQAASNLFEKTPLLVTRRLLSRGAVCAYAHAYVMYSCATHVLAFLVRPGALGSPLPSPKENFVEQV